MDKFNQKIKQIIVENQMNSLENLAEVGIVPSNDNHKLAMGILFDAPSFEHNNVNKEFVDPSKLDNEKMKAWVEILIKDLNNAKEALVKTNRPKVALQDIPKSGPAFNYHINTMVMNYGYETESIINRIDIEIKMLSNYN